jgi:UDPglucose 6-dehydrogenase
LRRALWITEGKTTTILGLAFKGGTDDVREAPALRVARAILAEGANVRLYDPKAMKEASHYLPADGSKVVYCNDPYEAGLGSDAILILTDWPEFQQLDLRRLRTRMNVPIIIDGKNLLDGETACRAGFEYYSMGRPSALLPKKRSTARPRRNLSVLKQAPAISSDGEAEQIAS